MKPFICALLLALFIPTVALANECDTGATPCDAYASADAVFIGYVTKITPEFFRQGQTDSDYDQTAYVRVERRYKGYQGARIVLHQLGRLHAEKFIANSSYLFYASYDKRARRWWVRPCGRTRLTDYVQDDLRYLAGLPKSAGRTRVAGRVTRYDANEETQGSTEPLAGVRLTIVGKAGEYEAVTDADGIYELYDLPSGEYTVRARIPAGLRFMLAMHYGTPDEMRERARDLTFEVRAGGCAGLGLILTTDAVPPRDTPKRVGKRDAGSEREGDSESLRR